MTSKLTNTVGLVTGASSGIGAATARALAGLGASVALVARRRDRLETLAAEITKLGGTALVVEADIAERAQAEAAVRHTIDRFGRLDILVNNAGLMLLGPVVGADEEEWDPHAGRQRSRFAQHHACRATAPVANSPGRPARAESPTSSISVRSPAASRGAATVSTTSPNLE
jgi:NAD(P)-dependent dehydrogenase (short-subunit alcohol dehydrogenase family)